MEFYVPFFKCPKIQEFVDVKSWRVIDPDECIRTGDILLFSNSSFMSSTIKFITHSRWNHIGMVCWCEMFHTDGTTTVDVFSFELGSQPYTDLMTGKMADKEVRLVRLADISNMYDVIAVRKLNSRRRTTNQKILWSENFMNFMWKWKKTPFYDPKILLKVHFISAGAPDNQTTCSAIAGLMLDYMDVFKLHFDPSQLAPRDFASDARAFPDHVFLGPEKIIYKDEKWINARLRFICIVFILILLIVIVLIVQFFRSKKKVKRK